MKTNTLKLLAFATGISMLVQSCGPTYVQTETQPPPYAQAPPPPPPVYNEPAPAPAPVQETAPAPAVNYQTFYNELSPYGQWINTPQYGYAWVPSAGPNFQPYGTAGHWVLSDYGWTWVSDYSWGWAPFHYGRWDFDAFYGWYWIPGYEWSPAWVSWRSTPGYYGWCPLGTTYAAGGYATYNCPPERYIFVQSAYITSPVVYNYYEPRSQCGVYYNRSTVVSNTYQARGGNVAYQSGPSREEVERVTNAPVRQVSLVQANSPDRAGVSGNEIRMYRPPVQQSAANSSAQIAPSRVYGRNEVTPVEQRPVITKPNQPRESSPQEENNHHPVQANQQNVPTQQQDRQQQAPVQQQQSAPVQQRQAVQQQQQTPVQQGQQTGQQHSATQPQRSGQQRNSQGKQKTSKPKSAPKQQSKQSQPVQPQGKQ